MPKSESHKKLLRPLSIAGLAFLAVHFLMTIGYTVHGLPIDGTPKRVVQSYMLPMFHQGWQLFAPNVPGYQNGLSYRVYDSGEWTDWFNAADLTDTDHRRIPYATQKVAKQLANQVGKRLYYVGDIPKLDKVKPTGAYYRAAYFCSRHYKIEKGHLPDSVQIALNYVTTPDFFTGKKEVEDVRFEFLPDGL